MTAKMPLAERRGILCRIGDSDNIGRRIVKLDDHTTVTYNKTEGPKLHQILLDHADTHDGKILVPFGYRVATKTIINARWFILWTTNDDYVMGRIHEGGDNYIKGMDDHDGYTAPKAIGWKTAKHWVKLHDVTGGHGFDMDKWTAVREIPGEGQTEIPLRAALDRTTTNCLQILIAQ